MKKRKQLTDPRVASVLTSLSTGPKPVHMLERFHGRDLLPLLKDMMTAGLVGAYWGAWHVTDEGRTLVGLDKRTLI